MRVGHYQAICKPGNFEANLSKVVEGLQRARRDRVEIVCFSECFLGGYYDREIPSRRSAFRADSQKMGRVLNRTRRFDSTFIVGFNELRGHDLYNSALVARRGRLLGIYSKCTAYLDFHKQGREFPVFQHDDVKFGVVICSDGGYIEPTRILALKGAQIVFAPHANYVGAPELIRHFTSVRVDHAARASENRIYFVRGNNVVVGRDPATNDHDGVGYGDSYILDRDGEIVTRSRRHEEDFIFADVHKQPCCQAGQIGRSAWSAREFGEIMLQAAGASVHGATGSNDACAHRLHTGTKDKSD